MAKTARASHVSARPAHTRTPPAHAKTPGAGSLDRLIHDHVRLGIVSALAVNETLSFVDLKVTLGATDGNLSVHARRLEEAGYVVCIKSFAGRTPHSDYKLTSAGRRALEKYLDHMDAIIRATRRNQ